MYKVTFFVFGLTRQYSPRLSQLFFVKHCRETLPLRPILQIRKVELKDSKEFIITQMSIKR